MYHQSSIAPPPPPPPLALPANNNLISKGKSPAPDRNALLAQIRGGKTLKKSVTNDRSSPQVNNSKSSVSVNNKISASHNDPLGLGNIFAQGKPKLRPSFKTDKPNTETITSKQNETLQVSNNTSKDIQAPSFNKHQFGKTNIPQLNTSDSYQMKNIPNKINSTVKVAKPIPPPANKKPNFNVPVISKLENSQGNKTLGRSFNSKPLLPPKLPEHSSKFATMHQQLNKTHLGFASPKLPVRNNSTPENLNELASSNVPKMNTLNPPTVKRSTSTGSRPQQIRAPNYRPPPPPPVKNTPTSIVSPVPPPPASIVSPIPPPPASIVPLVPPPVPKRSIANFPVSNLNFTNNPPPPPPPLRTTSKNYLMGHDFENRFNNNFHKSQEFPLPQYQQTSCKLYISQAETADLKHQKNMKNEKDMIRSIEC